MLLQLTISIFLAFSLGCSRVPHVLGLRTQDSPVVTMGKDKLGLVHLPGDFTRKDPEPGDADAVKLITTLRYEVRKPAGPASELILGMSDYLDKEGKPTISDDFYAVTLDGQFKVRRAKLEEWKGSSALPLVREEDLNRMLKDPVVGDQQGASYNGKHYSMAPGCTPSETKFFLSPGKKFLVVFSDDSKPGNRPGIPGFSGGARTEGHMYIDVYDTNSGEKILAGKAAHSGGAPSSLFDSSIWIGDNYFIVPLDPPGADRGSVGEDFFLAILPL